MPAPRPISCLLLLILALPAFAAADQAEREALRFNDAVTKLMQAREEALANHKAKAITTLTVIAKTRTKAEDAAGATDAWRAVLSIDREHTDARAYFTLQGTLDTVLAELDAKPTDLLGLDSGDAPVKEDAKNSTAEKAP
ncbi:MAG: hypothetical protein H0W78_06415 [Planctomycetes bacterium]|nr:hypothetical protein [Planctomycetota bacterium]